MGKSRPARIAGQYHSLMTATLPMLTGMDWVLVPLTKLSEARLARRVAADSTGSTTRPCNDARRVLIGGFTPDNADFAGFGADRL